MSTVNATAGSSKASTHLPNDARLIALLLASKGIADADERVLHQLMDFAHRYTSEIVSDAALFAEHAGRSGRVDVADVELAVKTRSAWEFEEAAPKDYLLPIAKQLNSQPLPIFSETLSHVRLPPKEHMLGGANFRLIPNLPPDRVVEGLVWEEESENGDEQEEKEDEEEEGDGKIGDGKVGEEDLDDDEDDVSMEDATAGGNEEEKAAGGNEEERAAKRQKIEDDDYDAE